MNSVCKMSVVLLAGAAIGGVAVKILHAQAAPPAYFFAEIDVTDADAYRTYVDRNTAVVQAAGGRFLARGGRAIAMDGAPPKRIVLIAWDNVDKAQSWYRSREYQEIVPIRDKAAQFRGFVIEGLSN